jgi:hypothetical protein
MTTSHDIFQLSDDKDPDIENLHCDHRKVNPLTSEFYLRTLIIIYFLLSNEIKVTVPNYDMKSNPPSV